MSMFIFLGILLGLVMTFALLVYGLGAAIKQQAQKPNKRFFAPIPRPGSFSFVVLEGKVIGIIENVVGWHLKEAKNVGNARCFSLGEKSEPLLLLQYILQRFLGVVWINLFATIKEFKDWKWTEFKAGEEAGEREYSITPRKENVSEFFFQFVYPVITDNVEIEGNIRVRIVTVLTVLHLHPSRAFFLNKDPIALFNAMVQSTLRLYVQDKDFNQVKAIRASDELGGRDNNSFWNELKKLNGIEADENGEPIYDKINQLGLFDKLGYYVVRAEVVQVEAVGDNAKAIEAVKIAELQGNATVMKAEKEAEALDKKREARQRWVNDTIVTPTGGAGVHVADVLTAEFVSGPDSKIQTWVEGDKANTDNNPRSRKAVVGV